MFSKVDITAIKLLCDKYRVPLPWALALTEVESAGRAFWTVGGRRVPAINLEGHYFDKRLTGDAQKKARSRGLSNPKAGKTKVPTSFAGRYAMLDDWMDINPTAALESVSMGVGQVMGAWWERLGFRSVQEMWVTANQSLAGQVDIMLRFLTTDPQLMKAIEKMDFKRVAYLYNGPAYKRNSYHTKIEKAVRKWGGTSRVAIPPNPTGMQRYDTTAELSAIKRLGYDDVRAFQQAHGLEVDGIIGPITREAIEKALAAAAKAPKVEAGKVAGGVAAGGACVAVGGELIEESTSTLEQIDPVLNVVQTLGVYGPKIAAAAIAILVLGTITYVVVRKLRRA